MGSSYERAFLQALSASLAAELVVIWLAVRCVLAIPRETVGRARLVAGVLLATGASLSYLWFVVRAFICLGGVRTAGIEAVITLAEAGVFRLAFPISWWRCLFLSLAANLASWGLGTVVRG